MVADLKRGHQGGYHYFYTFDDHSRTGRILLHTWLSLERIVEEAMKKVEEMLRIYTIQVSVTRRLGLTHDPNYLDITVKSGEPAFAPTWKMVMGVRQGKITEEEYTRQYYGLMRQSYRENRGRWEEVLGLEKVVLACYCRPDTFCHRYLLKDMLEKCGAEYAGEIRSLDDLRDL